MLTLVSKAHPMLKTRELKTHARHYTSVWTMKGNVWFAWPWACVSQLLQVVPLDSPKYWNNDLLEALKDCKSTVQKWFVLALRSLLFSFFLFFLLFYYFFKNKKGFTFTFTLICDQNKLKRNACGKYLKSQMKAVKSDEKMHKTVRDPEIKIPFCLLNHEKWVSSQKHRNVSLGLLPPAYNIYNSSQADIL